MNKIFPLLITVTRVACMLLGTNVILMSLPISVLTAAVPQGEDAMSSSSIFLFVVGFAALLASGFLMFAFGQSERRSAVLCGLNAALMLPPLGLGLVLLHATPRQFPHPALAYAIVGASAWVLMLCCIAFKKKVTG